MENQRLSRFDSNRQELPPESFAEPETLLAEWVRLAAVRARGFVFADPTGPNSNSDDAFGSPRASDSALGSV